VKAATGTAGERLKALAGTRSVANERFFEAEAGRVAQLCHAMAERFARGGRLLAFGASAADASDVRHVSVEFVHPVIVGKRALPAFGTTSAAIALLAEPDDVVMAFGTGPEVEHGVGRAEEAGALTVAFTPVGAAWEIVPPTEHPFVAQELAETAYHVLWELVHVFFEHRGLLAGRDTALVFDSGASSFLYPFLAEREDDLTGVLADVAGSARAKAAEVSELRERTLAEDAEAIAAAAAALRGGLEAGGRLLALGNGGSATDAMDVVADFTAPPPALGWPARPALDLTADPAILTAIANDIGPDAMFARQVIAYGRPADVLLAISTSGGSANVLAALAEARRRGLATLALVGYDGGRILAEGLADFVVVARSEHIPRIQEAQATVLHVLRELVEAPAG
jgi:D-sedoheptulose 7-phosphate isomerase